MLNATEIENKLSKQPQIIQNLFNLLTENALVGSPWAFVPQGKYDDLVHDLAKDGRFRVYKLTSDDEKLIFIVEAPRELVNNITSKIDAEMGQIFALAVNNTKTKAVQKFERHVESARKKGVKTETVGIYCVNQTQNATLANGERIPAYQLNIDELLALTNKLGVRASILKAPVNSAPAPLTFFPKGLLTAGHNAITVQLHY